MPQNNDSAIHQFDNDKPTSVTSVGSVRNEPREQLTPCAIPKSYIEKDRLLLPLHMYIKMINRQAMHYGTAH